MNRIISMAFAALLSPGLVLAQGELDNQPDPATEPRPLELTVTDRTGDLVEVSAVGDRVSIREILVALSGQLSRELKMEEGILGLIDEALIDLEVDSVPLQEFGTLVAGTAGLTMSIDDEALRLTHRLKEGTSEAGEEARQMAGEAYLRSGLHSFSAGEGGSLYRVAVLFFGGEQYSRALGVFKAFITSYPEDPRMPRARLLAGFCALQLERLPEARRFLVEIEDLDPQSSDILSATLLLAQVFMAEGQHDEALVRLRRIIGESDDARQKSTAILMRTKMWFDLGDWKEALASIEEYDLDLDRRVADRSSRVALARGLSRQRAGQIDRSFLPLQYAWLRMEEPHERLEAALAMARAWLAFDEHYVALQTLDSAGKLELEPHQRLRLLKQKAEVLEKFMLLPRLEKAYREMAELGLMEHPIDRERTTEALEGLANLLFEQQRYDDARNVFEGLRKIEELRARSVLMLARCEIAAGRYQEALTLLDGVDVQDERIDVAQVVKLRGESWLKLGDHQRAEKAFRGQVVREGK